MLGKILEDETQATPKESFRPGSYMTGKLGRMDWGGVR